MRLPRRVRLTITIIGFLFLLVFGLLVPMRLMRPGVLPGLTLASVELGGMTEEVARLDLLDL